MNTPKRMGYRQKALWRRLQEEEPVIVRSLLPEGYTDFERLALFAGAKALEKRGIIRLIVVDDGKFKRVGAIKADQS